MTETETPNPFEKVFLVARIATLEMTLAHQVEALKAKESAIADMASQLRSNAEKFSRLASLSLPDFDAACRNVSSWLSGEDAARWSELIKSREFTHAISVAMKTLILGRLHGGDAGSSEETGSN